MLLYLLVPSSSPTSGTIEVNGRLWSLQPFDLDRSDLVYSCISYTWGTGREPSSFDSSFSVSDRTIPALQTFNRHRPACTGIWIDAFCVPLTEPERAQTLESMGYIYARADEVMVVLSSAALPALTRMLESSRLDIADLEVLEREEWVERAWTYQETVNSKALFLTCGGEASALVPADRFFSCLGYALAHVEGTIVDKLRVYPRLNAFEDIMADFYTAGYEDRAALNIMSNMDRRVQARAEDHFYAMIGAISAERASAMGQIHPCEAFMRVCEKKSDFSFVYSAAKREEVPSRRWRPVPGDLPSILPWHGWGSRQPGRLCDDGLWLDDILVVHPAPLQEEARQFAPQWLANFWNVHPYSRQDLEAAVYAALQVMGFTGSPRCVTTTKGYFFPFEPVANDQVVSILVSTALRWSLGAPGLISYKDGHETIVLYTPGVYVGVVEGEGAISVLVG
ncbi:hypothetical protein N0V90_011913 [Kalmusia sp. IMI 367209]|nr:hypothetical protein N0V90_011913 [Kalmusia sp. IMI 367209]